MVLGMSLQAFTLIHVLISLTGIMSGSVVMYGFFTNKRLETLTALFFSTTVLTSITGFLFPYMGVTPGIKLGVISLVGLTIAIVTRYPLHLAWRKTYVIAACAALYFNAFVLVVQSFEKVSAQRAIAPTQKEPPFAIAQTAMLVLFVILTTFSVRKFRPEPTQLRSSAKAV